MSLFPASRKEVSEEVSRTDKYRAKVDAERHTRVEHMHDCFSKLTELMDATLTELQAPRKLLTSPSNEEETKTDK